MADSFDRALWLADSWSSIMISWQLIEHYDWLTVDPALWLADSWSSITDDAMLYSSKWLYNKSFIYYWVDPNVKLYKNNQMHKICFCLIASSMSLKSTCKLKAFSCTLQTFISELEQLLTWNQLTLLLFLLSGIHFSLKPQ